MQTAPVLYDSLTLPEATAIQNQLRASLDLSEMSATPTTIAGADISLEMHSETVFAGIVVLTFPELQPISYSLVKGKATFPYVPGYLAFREIPTILKAYEQLTVKPDLIMFDGNGILHARRLGIATHFGLITGSVTMGCAKKKLAGKYEEPEDIFGAVSPVIDRGEEIGYAFRSKKGVKPVFISPGNKMTRGDSLRIAAQCVRKHLLPEPTRRAHEYVNRFRTGELGEGYGEVEKWTLF